MEPVTKRKNRPANRYRYVRSNLTMVALVLVTFFIFFILPGIRISPPSKPKPTVYMTPTPTLPPQLGEVKLPPIALKNADQVASLAWMAHCGTGLALAWSPDGKTLALVGSGSAPGNVCLYDTTALDTPPRLLGGPGSSDRPSIAYSAQGKGSASGWRRC